MVAFGIFDSTILISFLFLRRWWEEATIEMSSERSQFSILDIIRTKGELK
jgi:hypothetical protein